MARLRITGGQARGRVLTREVPDEVRPTSARVREALFSLVGQDLEGTRVLDAFGGSGLVGLEAWSRGADVVIVEREPRTAQQIRDNVAALGATAHVVLGDVMSLIPGLGAFDGVFLDPPYRLDPGPIALRAASAASAWIVLELSRDTGAPTMSGWRAERRREYGATSLVVYRPLPKDEAV